AVPSLMLAVDHPRRVSALVLIGASVPFALDEERAAFATEHDSYSGWEQYNKHAWANDFERFCEFFFGEMFPEPHSTRHIECGREWAAGTTGELLAKTIEGARVGAREASELARRVTSPVLVVHGDLDAMRDYSQGVQLAEQTGGQLVTLAGSGHAPTMRDPVRANLLLREFLLPAEPPQTWHRAAARAQRALFVSSPIGLGHARRDIGIARELRRLRPGLEIEWLAQAPVTALLEAAGEHVHPASAELAGECAHIEAESEGHRLPVFDALRRMDEILVANFMLFHDVARDGTYDLWIGDEAWEVDHFLHENPELKCAPYVWLTDFVGFLPLPEGGAREALLTADYNAEMLEQVARYPAVRDRAIFVGDPDDVVSGSFGPGLPEIRPWVEAHYEFSGHITGFEPLTASARRQLRRELGWGEHEQICLVAVGGSGVGVALLQAVLAAGPAAARSVPGLRMVGVCGPRIDPRAIDPGAAELHGHVADLHRWLAACDVAVVQGGLTTTMELVAARRPFLRFPLERHFEQRLHVAHRLARHGAAPPLEFAQATPETLAQAIAAELGREVHYRGVPAGGAARAAALIAPLLAGGHSGAM
ncbi:MAG: hypothetical protein QOI71_3510, partial [Gaiellales bacterium]|nr:hypothetical protein [Gaiellales bacterium]